MESPVTPIYTFDCLECAATLQLSVLTVHTMTQDDAPTGRQVFGICVRCGRAALIEQTYSDGAFKEPGTRLYPVAATKTRELPPRLPRQVRQSIEEAALCESAGAWRATVMMVGRTLEIIAADLDVEAGTLTDTIKALVDKGLIGEQLSEWGHMLKGLQDYGAHVSEEQTLRAQDARDALDFLEVLVTMLYPLTVMFEAFKKRTAKSRRKKKA